MVTVGNRTTSLFVVNCPGICNATLGHMRKTISAANGSTFTASFYSLGRISDVTMTALGSFCHNYGDILFEIPSGMTQNKWNDISVQVKGNAVQLELNGETIIFQRAVIGCRNAGAIEIYMNSTDKWTENCKPHYSATGQDESKPKPLSLLIVNSGVILISVVVGVINIFLSLRR